MQVDRDRGRSPLVGRRNRVLACLAIATATASASASGCYTAPRPECGFICGDDGSCPSGYSCSFGDWRCHLDGSSPSLDCKPEGFRPDAMIVPDAADDEPPAVVFMMPVPNASNVSVAPTIIVGFSEPVQGVSEATFMLYGPGLIPAQVSYEPSIPGAALMPARTLLANTEHDVYLDSTITDAAGHPLTPVQWSFTTGADLDPPMVINSSPAPTETDVGTTAPVVVVFSEVVFNVSDATFTVDNAGTPIDGMVFMSTQDQAVFTPTSPYPAGATISVNLTAGIMDINGNALVPLSFSFTVAP